MALVRSSGIGMTGLGEVVADAQVRSDVKDKFGPLMKLYEQYLDVDSYYYFFTGESTWLEQNVNKILTVPEINTFLHLTQVYQDHQKYNFKDEGRTGKFLTRLMEVAYGQGETNFFFNMNGLQPLHYLGVKLPKIDNKEINVTIKGAIGDNCFVDTMLKTVNIDTVGDRCFIHAKVGTANIGTAGNNCLGEATVETANVGIAGHGCLECAVIRIANIKSAGDWCLHSATVETAYIGTAGDGCLGCAKEVKEVYTSDSSLFDKIKSEPSIPWKPGCGVHLVSADELAEKMRKS